MSFTLREAKVWVWGAVVLQKPLSSNAQFPTNPQKPTQLPDCFAQPLRYKTSGAHQVWLSESHTLRSKKFKWIWRWSQSSLNLSLKSLIEESLKKFVSHANLYQWNTTYAIAFVKIQVQVPFCFKIMASLPCLSCPPLMERAPHHEVWSAQGKQLLHQPAKSPVETPELVQSNQEGNTQQWDRNE